VATGSGPAFAAFDLADVPPMQHSESFSPRRLSALNARHDLPTNGSNPPVGRGISMISILILIALSALSGFAAGSFFPWSALVVTGAGLAPLAAFALQRQDFTALSGISIIVACLAVNQAAYVIAVRLSDDQGGDEDHLPQQRPDCIPDDDGNDDIRREDERHQKTHLNLARFAIPGRRNSAL
jgi:hypothetical protein